MQSLVGKVIKGRYRVDEFVGRGGMAEVYKVWDLERSTYLALKMLPEDMADDPVFIRRFKREAQALARLQHPNIVRFYSFEQDRTLAFILMDFIDGSSLRREIAQSQAPFTPQRVMEYMNALCSALYFAHNEGYIHCDIKPANVLVKRSGQILLSDFGIAQNTESTATMVGAGTAAYMSPEQARGETPTAQSDIYSLGIVLFEMLTGGHRPFIGEQVKGTGTMNEKVRWEQLNLKPPSPQVYNQGISPAVAKVVLQCLEKDPSQRFATALVLLNALQAAFGETQSAAVPTRTSPEQSISQSMNGIPIAGRNKGLIWTAAAVVGVVLLVAIVAFTNSGSQGPSATVTSKIITQVPKSNTSRTAQTTGTSIATLAPTDQPTITPEPTFTVEVFTLVLSCDRIGLNAQSPQDGAEIVCVPEGSFLMGSDPSIPDSNDEQPVHLVYLNSFWIDKTEVTNKLYALCVNAGFCNAPKETRSNTRPSYYNNPSFSNYPVIFVQWSDADRYCKWAGKRLPTEAEWEKAARGTDQRIYPWGNSFPNEKLANFGKYLNDTTEVGHYPAGASFYGAFDMAGNVYEWVWDYYNKDYYKSSPGSNPQGPYASDNGVIRGGSFVNLVEKVSSAKRLAMPRTLTGVNYGFRCVSEPIIKQTGRY